MKGSDIIIESLIRRGITAVAGIPGGAVLPLYDSLAQSPIRHILARSEQGAGFIAHGMARSTGKPAVCIATSGPGATNLVTPIADAFHDSVPLIAITGQVSRHLIGRNAFQECDIASTCAAITKKAYRVERTEDLAEIIADAFMTAESGRKGPVLIDIPRDVMTDECEYTEPDAVPIPEKETETDRIRQACEMINASRRPLILAGGGATSPENTRLVRILAEKSGIPCTHTLMGKGVIPDGHPLSIGLAGMHAESFVHTVFEEADCIIILGSRISDRVGGKTGTFAAGKTVIRVDIGTPLTDVSVSPDIEIDTGIERALPAMIQLIDPKYRDEWTDRIDGLMSAERRTGNFPDQESPAALALEISGQAENDAIFCTDVGQHQFWAAKNISIDDPRHFITSGGFGTMGFGLPAAIGCAIANPGRKIILVTGDGSLMMNLQELALIPELGLDISIVVFNNGHLGLVKQQQELFWNGRFSECRFINRHDFKTIAHGFGILSHGIANGDYGFAADHAARKGACLIDVTIPGEENIYPIVPPGKANRETITEEDAAAVCGA
jgi:acetolactate synthase-1/2/3 large subunit